MSVINKVTEDSYVQWMEEFVCKVLENANIEFDIVEIEDIEIDKRIFIKVDGADYIIRTWNFHTVGLDYLGNVCCEDVEYTLFKCVDDHGEEISEGNLEIQWKN